MDDVFLISKFKKFAIENPIRVGSPLYRVCYPQSLDLLGNKSPSKKGGGDPCRIELRLICDVRSRPVGCSLVSWMEGFLQTVLVL